MVEIPKYLQRPIAQNLAYRIVENLEGYPKIFEDKAQGEITVAGSLPLGDADFCTKKKAFCTFALDWQWVWQMPLVICREHWVSKGEPDWHAYDSGQLCFDFDVKWAQVLTAMEQTHTIGRTADYAVAWLLNSTRSLLNRHLFAFRQRLPSWPQKWDFWPHGREAATRELQIEQTTP